MCACLRLWGCPGGLPLLLLFFAVRLKAFSQHLQDISSLQKKKKTKKRGTLGLKFPLYKTFFSSLIWLVERRKAETLPNSDSFIKISAILNKKRIQSPTSHQCKRKRLLVYVTAKLGLFNSRAVNFLQYPEKWRKLYIRLLTGHKCGYSFLFDSPSSNVGFYVLSDAVLM